MTGDQTLSKRDKRSTKEEQPAAHAPNRERHQEPSLSEDEHKEQCRNPTKKIVQSRRISVSGNGTAHPSKKIGIVDPSCDSKREFATGERLESGFSQSG